MHTTGDVVLYFKKLIEENPDNLNPTDGDVCVYTAEYDPSSHCIAGQFVVDFGYPAIDSEVQANWCNLGDYYPDVAKQLPPVSDIANEIIDAIQFYADNSGQCRLWGEIDIDEIVCNHYGYMTRKSD